MRDLWEALKIRLIKYGVIEIFPGIHGGYQTGLNEILLHNQQ